MRLIYLGCATFLLVINAVLADIPADIPKCRAGDTKCIADVMTLVIRKYPDGYPEIGLPSISNVVVNDIVAAKPSKNSAVQMDLRHKTLLLQGFENIIIKKVVGFEKDLSKSKFEIYGIIPYLKITGDYTLSGKVLLLPIQGEGSFEGRIKDSKFIVKIKLKSDFRDGKEYAKVDKVVHILEPEGYHLNVSNLFNGNKELGETMNALINDNWRDIWPETKNGIEKMGADIAKTWLGILKLYPYEDLFKKE